MAKLFVVVVAMVMAACQASSIREKRQAYNSVNCGQNNGPVPDPNDCSFFFDCFNGQATRMACVAGLEFNPDYGYCDFPNNIQNLQCQRVSPSSQNNARCNGLPNNALVAHDRYCNAFMYCGNGFLLDGCSFCAFGQYFDQASQRCVATYNVDTQRECNGKQMVAPIDQELSRLDGSCFPSDPNRFQVLIEKIQREGGYRPINNGGYNPNNNNNGGGYNPNNNNNGGYNPNNNNNGGYNPNNNGGYNPNNNNGYVPAN